MKEKSKRKEIESLERELADLQRMARPDLPSGELDRLRNEISQLRQSFYKNLGAWQRTLLARHPQRPYMMDYVRLLFEGFQEFDNLFANPLRWWRLERVLLERISVLGGCSPQ